MDQVYHSGGIQGRRQTTAIFPQTSRAEGVGGHHVSTSEHPSGPDSQGMLLDVGRYVLKPLPPQTVGTGRPGHSQIGTTSGCTISDQRPSTPTPLTWVILQSRQPGRQGTTRAELDWKDRYRIRVLLHANSTHDLYTVCLHCLLNTCIALSWHSWWWDPQFTLR